MADIDKASSTMFYSFKSRENMIASFENEPDNNSIAANIIHANNNGKFPNFLWCNALRQFFIFYHTIDYSIQTILSLVKIIFTRKYFSSKKIASFRKIFMCSIPSWSLCNIFRISRYGFYDNSMQAHIHKLWLCKLIQLYTSQSTFTMRIRCPH